MKSVVSMWRPIGWAVTAVLLPMLAGCEAFMFNTLFLSEEPTKRIPAEYKYLQKQTVCILVRVEPETLFEYPHVQWEVADHVRVALEANVKGLKVVDPKRVVEFQRRDANWSRMDPAELGKRFGAERVIEITLTQYTTRDPDSPHIHRGHIHALVNVYQSKYPGHEPSYSTEIRTFYPPVQGGEWGQPERTIRRLLMEAFAQDVAGKFYDRDVKDV